MTESGDKKHVTKNLHRPLIAVSSCAGRMQAQGKEKEGEKVKSLLDISNGDISTVERRRRSKSMPLTLEATVVAKELKRLSDTLSSRYEVKKKERPRRHTFGSSKDKKEDRFSFHSDKDYNQFEDPIDEAPEYGRGTSV